MKMRREIVVLSSAALLSCVTPGAPAGSTESASVPPIPPTPTGPRPGWVDLQSFVESSTAGAAIYGVGQAELETAPGCWDLGLLFKTAENRARHALLKLTSGDETPDGALRGVTIERGWFDGEKVLFVLARVLRENEAPPPKAIELSPTGGVHPRALADAVKTRNRAVLEVSGACDDAHRRAGLTCCGELATFCSDARRYDRAGPGGTCACGKEKPCLYDFECQARSGEQRCVCNGARCPCEILNCRPGQVCGDGRCY